MLLSGEKGGLEAGTEDYLWVQFEFVDDGKDQNIFQGDSLNLEWTFNANQEAGEENNKKRVSPLFIKKKKCGL